MLFVCLFVCVHSGTGVATAIRIRAHILPYKALCFADGMESGTSSKQSVTLARVRFPILHSFRFPSWISSTQMPTGMTELLFASFCLTCLLITLPFSDCMFATALPRLIFKDQQCFNLWPWWPVFFYFFIPAQSPHPFTRGWELVTWNCTWILGCTPKKNIFE